MIMTRFKNKLYPLLISKSRDQISKRFSQKLNLF